TQHLTLFNITHESVYYRWNLSEDGNTPDHRITAEPSIGMLKAHESLDVSVTLSLTSPSANHDDKGDKHRMQHSYKYLYDTTLFLETSLSPLTASQVTKPTLSETLQNTLNNV